MKRPNPSLVVSADHKIRMQEAPIHEPQAGQVLIHVRTTGICGSDVHFWRHGKIGDIVVEGDCILGHEPAGVVLKLGPGVTGLKEGDRVALEPGVPCGVCFLCASGKYNLCEDVAFAGVYPYDGTIQRYKVHPARYTHKLPHDVSFACAALLEPLSVALHALRTSPISVGTPVAVCGAGPIGLLTMAAARASGAHPIVITDIDQRRLDFAKKFEPNCLTYQIQKGDTPEQSGQKIRRLFEKSAEEVELANPRTEYDMPAVVLECTGIESSILTAGFTVRRGGTMNIVGVSARNNIDNVPFMKLSLAEVKILFINRYSDTWPAAIRALQGQLIPPEKLESMVTHRFKLEDAVAALELVGGAGASREGDGEVIVKV